MSIKLDWEIEAEERARHTAGEDPEMRRRRRRLQRQLLIMILFLLAIVGGIVGVVWLRLREVDQQIEQVLRDTVDAEIAALRIGDRAAFLNVQHQDNQEWLQQQEITFDTYQSLKLNSDVSLTGRIVETKIDGPRGRVQIEEIINGTPFTQLWFYWRFEDGWRHVPTDYTFWDEVDTIQGERVDVRYRGVDEQVARSMSRAVGGWLETGCATLGCDELPELMIEIVSGRGVELGWSEANPWTLQVPSPFLGRARLDQPFDAELRLQVANQLADRLVAQVSSNMQPNPVTDAAYLRGAVVSWLVSRFVELQPEAHLIDSLAQNYGDQAIARLVQILQPEASISILNQVTATASLEQAQLDWRDFLTWRLNLEKEMFLIGDEANYLRLYELRDPGFTDIVFNRYNSGFYPEDAQQVVSVLAETVDGVPQLRAGVITGDNVDAVDEVTFRLVDGVWLRAS